MQGEKEKIDLNICNIASDRERAEILDRGEEEEEVSPRLAFFSHLLDENCRFSHFVFIRIRTFSLL